MIRIRLIENLIRFLISDLKLKLITTLSKQVESCRNPWKEKCKKTDIEVYIYYKNKCIPICKKCWCKIAEKDIR
jgi:hypothetical protein